MAVLKTAPPRFLVHRIWDQWSWRQHFRADLSARVRMMWRPLVQSFGGCNDHTKLDDFNFRKMQAFRLRHGQLHLLLEPSGSACMVFWFALTSRKFHDVHILMIWADLMEGPGIAWFTNGSTVRLYVWLKELHNWFLFTQEPRPGWGPTRALTVRNLGMWNCRSRITDFINCLDIGLGPRHRPTALSACTMGGQTCRI